MKLTKKALNAIALYSPTIKSRLALALRVSENAINRYIRDNEKCDELTKAASLAVLREFTGFKDEEILEESIAQVR